MCDSLFLLDALTNPDVLAVQDQLKAIRTLPLAEQVAAVRRTAAELDSTDGAFCLRAILEGMPELADLALAVLLWLKTDWVVSDMYFLMSHSDDRVRLRARYALSHHLTYHPESVSAIAIESLPEIVETEWRTRPSPITQLRDRVRLHRLHQRLLPLIPQPGIRRLLPRRRGFALDRPGEMWLGLGAVLIAVALFTCASRQRDRAFRD